MLDKKAYFDKLDKLHEELEKYLKDSSRDCAGCVDCCLNIGDASIFIPLYVDYINYNFENTGNTKYKPMTWEEGLETCICPYLDFKSGGCGIYPFRALICRVYPRLMDKSESSLYHKCSFADDYEQLKLNELIPHKENMERVIDEISRLNIEYIKENPEEKKERYKKALEHRVDKDVKRKNNISLYKSFLELDPKAAYLHYHIGKALLELGEKPAGLKEIEEAIKMDEGDYRARLLKAKIFLVENKTDEAIVEMKHAVELNPSVIQAYYILGILYLMKGEYEASYREFNKLLNLYPDAKKKYDDLQGYMDICKSKGFSFKTSGVNLSWEKGREYMHYGYDFGRGDGHGHIGFSNPASKEKLDKALKELSSAGVKTIRVFFFCDFRAGVHFDEHENLYFDEYVYKDSDAFFDTARKYSIKVIPVLMDFYIANKWNWFYNDSFDHPELLKDDKKRGELVTFFGSYINMYSKKYGDVIQAWDLFNEPEWGWAIGMWFFLADNDPRVKYVKEMYKVAKENSFSIPITTGWCFKENAVKFKDYTDIIQAHCYWENLFTFTAHLSQKCGEKMVIIGEAGAKDIKHMEEILKIAQFFDVEILFWDAPGPGCPKRFVFDHELFSRYMSEK